MNEAVSLQGLVEMINGELVLMIPLDAISADLLESSRGTSEVHDAYLKIAIPCCLAGLLRFEKGDLVCVHNMDGQFNIQPVKQHPVN